MGKLADSSTNLRSTGKREEGGKKEIYVSLTIVSKAWRYIYAEERKKVEFVPFSPCYSVRGFIIGYSGLFRFDVEQIFEDWKIRKRRVISRWRDWHVWRIHNNYIIVSLRYIGGKQSRRWIEFWKYRRTAKFELVCFHYSIVDTLYFGTFIIIRRKVVLQCGRTLQLWKNFWILKICTETPFWDSAVEKFKQQFLQREIRATRFK